MSSESDNKVRRITIERHDSLIPVRVIHSSELSEAEKQRLTLFKWRYSLNTQGFTSPEATGLLFLRWLRVRRPLAFK